MSVEHKDNRQVAVSDTGNSTCRLKIHSVESFGTFDGPGIRFVVFLQGCPMRCLYCANPDTMRYDTGEYETVDSLFGQVMRVKPYFSSGGGVTASGGEPCCQAKNLIPFFKKLKEQGIHTALDTNGSVMNGNVEGLLKWTDLVLLDIKQMNTSMHEIITGRNNQKVLEFASYLKQIGKPCWLRYVLIPGLTDNPDHLHALGKHFKEYENIEKLEIQPYHKLGMHKWEMLGEKYSLEDIPVNSTEQLAAAKKIFEEYFDEVVIN